MVKTDVFERETIILRLDKPYLLRFTLRVVYMLECRYGDIHTAVRSLFNKGYDDAAVAVGEFLFALTGLSRERIYDLLDVDTYYHALETIYKAFIRDFPPNGEHETDEGERKIEPYDWDSIYYTARYRLLMGDDEFWGCTPRRFWKLDTLWRLHHGLKEQEEEIYMGEVAY
jgi:hypothetical protein